MLTTEEKQSLADGFKAAGTRMDEIENNSKQAIVELAANLNELARQLKRYGRNVLSASSDAGEYRGFWADEKQAKTFGGIVLKLAGMEVKDMAESVNTEGGILVPDEMANWIIQKLGKYGKFRKNALPVKLGTSRQIIPKVTTDLTIYCPGEGVEITKSDMKFGMVGMDVRKLACLCVINRELDEDSIVGLGEIVGLSISRSMAKKEDLIGFLGDGTSTYFGMRGIVGALLAVDETIGNIPGLVVGSGNAYSELTLANFRSVVGRLPGEADDDAKWFMNKRFYFDVVYPLAENAGAAKIVEILSDRKDRHLLGYPVEFVSCMPYTEANSQICAILGDLQIGAFLAERRVLEIARSDEVLFGNDQIAIRGTERIDIAAYGVGDTTEPGPIVALITAAA